MKSVFLATAAAIALLPADFALAGGLPGLVAFDLPNTRPPLASGKVKTLYTQNSNDSGVGIDSQNFSSGSYSTNNPMGADDFIIPTGQLWKIGTVDVTGVYFNGLGPAKSENVIFWKNSDGTPGGPVKRGTYDKITCADTSGSFACKLPRKLILRAGHYWVTVQANLMYSAGGEWGWDMSSVIHNDDAQWEDPGPWVPCPHWATLYNCVGYNGDFMFDLKD